MYYLFYCPDFETPNYQLSFISANHSMVGTWETSITKAINIPDSNFSHSNITTPEDRIKRFETSHNGNKTLHLIAQAPTQQAFYDLYPELFI